MNMTSILFQKQLKISSMEMKIILILIVELLTPSKEEHGSTVVVDHYLMNPGIQK